MGRAAGGSGSVAIFTVATEAGHLAYGPYASNWGALFAAAEFCLQVDDNTADNNTVVTLDLYDATDDEILVLREVRRQEFGQASTYQAFEVTADLTGRKGHTLESRVYWHDVAYIKLDRVVVATR